MKKLVAYITSGYPEKSFSIDLALALAQSGVDAIELGVPFSDPVADGPAIERANHKALELGFKFKDLLEISEIVAPKVDTLWMGYFNSFYQHDLNNLIPLARKIGVNGLIIPDLPYEETLTYKELFDSNSISNITFVAPTSESAKRYMAAAEAIWATIEKINEEGGVDNAGVQPTTPPGVSACSTGASASQAAPQQSSDESCGTGCGCH